MAYNLSYRYHKVVRDHSTREKYYICTELMKCCEEKTVFPVNDLECNHAVEGGFNKFQRHDLQQVDVKM